MPGGERGVLDNDAEIISVILSRQDLDYSQYPH